MLLDAAQLLWLLPLPAIAADMAPAHAEAALQVQTVLLLLIQLVGGAGQRPRPPPLLAAALGCLLPLLPRMAEILGGVLARNRPAFEAAERPAAGAPATAAGDSSTSGGAPAAAAAAGAKSCTACSASTSQH